MAEKLPVEITGTLDVECADWNKFALGVCYDGTIARHWWGSPSELSEDDLPESLRDLPDQPGSRSGEFGGLDGMLDYLRARGGVWWGHGLGIYDGLAILERCRVREIPCQIDRSANRVTRIVLGSTQLRDSYALWPVPLDDICGALRRKVPHLPWPCLCGRKTCSCGRCGGCGGYCRIAEKARQGDPDLLDYCTADARDLYDGLHGLRELATRHKIRLRGTLGQTAWTCAQEELGVPDSAMPWDLWREVRRADKGGRSAIVRPRVSGPDRVIAHYDICNAYPAQLAKAELPVGKVRQLGGPSAARALSNCRPGIYVLTVKVPEDSFLPPLPWAHGGIRYPVGEISGAWVLPELVCAFERGVSVVKVHAAILWEAVAPIFGPLVDRWYEIRRQLGRKTPHGQWFGRLAKAFTGKLAEQPDRQRVTMHPDSIKVCLRQGPCRDGCTFRCGAYEQLDLYGHIYGIPYRKLSPSAYPQWSAYLRAMTRIQWLEQAERQGTDLVFGNTDSIWTLGRDVPRPAGDGLGQWEFQDAWSELDVRSPTVYAGRRLPDRQVLAVDRSHAAPSATLERVPGEFVVRGIPHATEEDWKRGQGVIDRGVVTFTRAAKSTRGLFAKRIRKWTLPEGDGERVLWGDRRLGDGGITYPMHAREIREQVALARQKARQKREAPRPRGRRGKA